ALAQLVDHRLGVVDGDGEADVLGVAAGRRVDADDLPGAVDQRATGVARVDGGVGLDEPAQALASAPAFAPGVDRAVEGRDDALGHGHPALQVEGVADGDHAVANLQIRGLAELC